MSGFTPPTTQFDLNNIISKEVFRVFVLQCQSTSHLTYLVSFHRVSPIIYNYRMNTVIQITFIHTSIHSYFHTLMHTQHIHDINSYMVASVPKVLFGRTLSFQSSNCFKPPVLKNGPLEFTFYLVSSRHPKNGPLEFTF